MTPTPTVHSLLFELLSGPEWTQRLARGWGAQRTDVLRQIASRIVFARWQTGRTPQPTDPLSVERLPIVEAMIDKHRPLIAEAVDLQLRIVGTAVELAAEQGIKVTRSALSEPVSSVVGAAYVQDPPARLDPQEVAQHLLLRFTGRPQRLTDDELVTQYLEDYHREWDTSPHRDRPSSIGLGSDERPPFVHARRENSWQLGTDRSVCGRYRLYFIGAGRHDPRTCADEEVRRACAGFGLLRPEHRTALRSISIASADAGRLADAVQVWNNRQQTRTVATGPVDESLTLEIAAKIRVWFGCSSAGKQLTARQGDVGEYSEVLSMALVRKVWMGLHAHERNERPVLAAADIHRLLGPALDKAVPEVVPQWMLEPPTDPPSLKRCNRSYAVLVEHQPLLTGTATEYVEFVHRKYGPAWSELVLTPDELRDQFPTLFTEEDGDA
ncbi:hypothetical protein [Kribbella monticola]|uniref:hypothetical protein n=1 Tax=Kribbella monticola TaxID=2185285 RepID=UPI000DD3B111|nr:hypothetical protein [Kribbella monticola]